MKLKNSIRRIDTKAGRMRVLLLCPEEQANPVPGLLWIHGGGYMTGVAAMAYFTMGRTLAKHFGCVLLAPEYRKATKAPYPAALEDCYEALLYLWNHAAELGVDQTRIIVGAL